MYTKWDYPMLYLRIEGVEEGRHIGWEDCDDCEECDVLKGSYPQPSRYDPLGGYIRLTVLLPRATPPSFYLQPRLIAELLLILPPLVSLI